jgi:uncharacterized protein (DUF4415 family)
MSSRSRGATKSDGSSPRGPSATEAKEDTKRYSWADIDAMEARGEVFETPPDAPTYELPEEFWKNAYVVRAGEGRTVSVHLRVDRYVLEWFKRQGKGHLTRMNAVLRAYYEAHRGP